MHLFNHKHKGRIPEVGLVFYLRICLTNKRSEAQRVPKWIRALILTKGYSLFFTVILSSWSIWQQVIREEKK